MMLYCLIKKKKYLLFLDSYTFIHKIYQISKSIFFYKIFFDFFVQNNILFNIKKVENFLLSNKKYPIFFFKNLVMKGRGYKCVLDKSNRSLILKLGFSHYIKKIIPNIIKIDLKKNKIVFKSLNFLKLEKYSIGIRNIRKVNAYKKKGLFFSTDLLKFKQVKKK